MMIRWLLYLLAIAPGFAAGPRWVNLSSKNGELPVPGESTQQTGALAADLDRDGAADFVISFRQKAPALAWYRFNGKGWDRFVVEPEFLSVEAGGAAYDIDGDGDLDIVFGCDARCNQLWWWENPYPKFDPKVPWKRHTIKASGANQHHDQIFADLEGTGQAQLVFWNQKAKTLFLAPIPRDPRNTGPWPLEVIYSGAAGEEVESAARYAEGLDAADIDGDGRPDLVAGNSWFKYRDGQFTPTRIGTIAGRIRAGRFKPGKYPQVVIAPGDGSGPLKFYECEGDPMRAASWKGRALLDRDMVHGHTLDIGDIDGDGHLDIFAAEMAKWTEKRPDPDNPHATAWILYGDGRGNFRATVFKEGHGWHEGRLADLNGDGRLDILNKPYNWEAPRIDVWLQMGPLR
jgi:hypothetical protein